MDDLINVENMKTAKINNTSSDSNELETIVKMYQDGLLTEDEFAAMKKKIIGN